MSLTILSNSNSAAIGAPLFSNEPGAAAAGVGQQRKPAQCGDMKLSVFGDRRLACEGFNRTSVTYSRQGALYAFASATTFAGSKALISPMRSLVMRSRAETFSLMTPHLCRKSM